MRQRTVFVVVVSFLVSMLAAAQGRAQSQEVFQIGTKDNSFTEFARGRKPGIPVVYRAGQSSAAKDWCAYQPGTFDYEVGRSSPARDWTSYRPGSEGTLAKDPVPMPFQVDFELPSVPRGKFILQLDAIFRYQKPAAPWYVVDINGHTGRYRLSPRPAPELWWPVGPALDEFIGYESLAMPLPATYFRKGSNTLRVRCEGGFGIYYDDLALRNEAAAGVPRVVSGTVEPTIFYKTRNTGLVELANVWVRTSRPLERVSLRVEVGSTKLEKAVEQKEFGDASATFEVPTPEKPVPVTVYITGERTPVYRGMFEPERRWKVYAMPMEQADFGYDEVPSRTLEWGNRYLDKVLEILKEFPSYSFTLDAAANLESYLATRDETRGKQVLEHLRNGRLGTNALYENFFTGLATPEELIHLLEYALLAGRQYGFTVDSASQTDEPSVTGAFPQLLAEAGIKYYADGSDPIRGPFNAIGLLNLQSPFYWEGPNGAKVLVWSAVHYIGLKDMTWEGWNLEAARAGKYTPSLFGLEHSLPLFLSEYGRPDYPFDAVFLYGLHDDEDPMRHYGDADVIEMWNKEYAYPQMIPATQRDYFRYVTDHFGSQIRTYRGDGGAYWEDEAGADARIAAMNRASQTRILAAEKLESVANWLQSFLRFDYAPFLDAWKNIMLADCYVWSDALSFHRPESYRTRFGEATHRAWAAAAQQQTWDLRLRAMDKIAELIGTENPGVVVFNPESWTRNGFFDFELEPDESLADPATGQNIPCGSLRFLNGYQEVRCWAVGVPPLGYKYYAIVRGKVPAAKPVTLENPAAPIEGKFFSLQLDLQSGAIAHLIDKTTGEELVNAGPGYGLNEYLYVTGGEEGNNHNRLLAADPTLPLPQLTIHRPTLVGKPTVCRYPWGTVVTVHTQAVNTPEILSTITLNDEQKVVSFDNEVEKTSTLKKEGVYFAFPFAVQQPHVEYQGATAWVNPVSGMLPGANRQWFTTQGGVRVVGTNQSISWVTVDAPLITLEDINRGLWPASLEIRNGTVFSYAMNNYWNEDAPAQQGGHFTFRYALTSGRELTPSDSTYLSLAQRSPLLELRHEHKEWKQTLPVEGTGFLSSSPVGVVVLTVRPGPSQDTYLVRVHNTTGQEVKASLQFPHIELDDAYWGSVLGDRSGSVGWSGHEVHFPMPRFDVKTLVVHTIPGQN
jgi:alpha-mannosidase